MKTNNAANDARSDRLGIIAFIYRSSFSLRVMFFVRSGRLQGDRRMSTSTYLIFCLLAV